MSDLVYAIVSIYDTAELLPHFLSHYSQLGWITTDAVAGSISATHA